MLKCDVVRENVPESGLKQKISWVVKFMCLKFEALPRRRPWTARFFSCIFSVASFYSLCLATMSAEVSSARRAAVMNIHALIDATWNLKRKNVINAVEATKIWSYQTTSQPAAKNSDKEPTDVSDETWRASSFCIDLKSAGWTNCVRRVRT